MSFTRCDVTVNNIQSLTDRPNDDGKSAEDLKKAFDQTGSDLKEFINGLINELEAITSAGNLGISPITGLAAANVQEALAALKAGIDNATVGQIMNNSLTTEKYQDGSVTNEKLAAKAVGTSKLAPKAVTGDKVADGTLEKRNYANGSVDGDIIAAKAIDNTHISDGGIATENLADSAVGNAKIADGAISFAKLANGAVRLRFTSQGVARGSFVADATYADYPFRAAVVLTGVTADFQPDICFSLADVQSGNFAPVAETFNGGVYLYAAAQPDADLTIPVMTFTR
jgi:hypothetical protein